MRAGYLPVEGSDFPSRRWKSRLLAVLAALLVGAAFAPLAPDASSSLRAAVAASGVAPHVRVNSDAVSAGPIALPHRLNTSKPAPTAVLAVLALAAILFGRRLRSRGCPDQRIRIPAALPLRRAPPDVAFH